jgi:hypothetical protein
MHDSETMTSASISSDFGWGDSDAPKGLGNLGSAILVIASGLYGASVWVAGGLPPLAYFASRRAGRSCEFPEGARGPHEYC